MSKDKERADSFIAQNIGQFGLNGTNTIHNPDREYVDPEWPTSRNPRSPMSRDNHLVFGYDGKPFNDRRSSTSVFWVGYGKMFRNSAYIGWNLRDFANQAIDEIREAYGEFRCLVAPPHRIPHPQYHDVVKLMISRNIPMTEIGNRHIEDSVTRQFRSQVRTNSMTNCEKIVFAQHSDLPVVDLTTFPVLNFRSRALEDREEDFAFGRWLLQNDHPGVPSFWRWSPDLFGSILLLASLDRSLGVPDWHKWFGPEDCLDKCDERWLTSAEGLTRLLPTGRWKFWSRAQEEWYGTVL